MIDPPRYFYPAPLWRRLVVILVCGLIGVPAIVMAVRHQLLGQPVRFSVGVSVFVSVSSMVLLLFLRARIRVDADGIASRGMTGWRRCPWSDILARPPQTLCVGQGPWTNAPGQIRRLSAALKWLEDKDAAVLYEMLTPAGTCTHLPELPRRFRMQIFGLKWLEIDTEGLRLEEDHGSAQTWYWNDVRQVKIRKETDTSRAVDGMWIELCDGTRFPIIHKTIECECPCRCRHDYLLQQFLRNMLPADKVLVWAKVGEPASITEAKYRRDSTESGLRTGRKLALCYGILVATLLYFGLVVGNRRCMGNAIELIAWGVFLGPGLCGVFRQSCRERDMLQAYLDARNGAKARTTV